MGVGNYLAFDLAILVAVMSPGPAFLITAQTALRFGGRAGILVALGLASSACLWMLFAFLGLSTLFTLVPWSYLALKFLGAAYLLYIAYHLWRHAHEPLLINEGHAVHKHQFARGFLTNLLNPKAALFISSIYITVVPTGLDAVQAGYFIAHQFIIETGWYGFVALALSGSTIRAGYIRSKSWLDRTAAGILGALGISFLRS